MSLTYDVLKDDVRAGRPIDFGFVTYVPERTCQIVVSVDRNPASYGGRVHRCSSCGKALPGALCRNGWTQLDYCPRCGAHVIGTVSREEA